MKHFKLYGTSACHLCELAQGLLQEQVAVTRDIEVEVLDIAAAEPLFERYGTRIPVLRHADGRELDWPFSPAQLGVFLRS